MYVNMFRLHIYMALLHLWLPTLSSEHLTGQVSTGTLYSRLRCSLLRSRDSECVGGCASPVSNWYLTMVNGLISYQVPDRVDNHGYSPVTTPAGQPKIQSC